MAPDRPPTLLRRRRPGRAGGVVRGAVAPCGCQRADDRAGRPLRGAGPGSAVGLDDLYWSMRVTLVRRQPDLETFDRVFAAVFESERGSTRTPAQGRRPRAPPPHPVRSSRSRAGASGGRGGPRLPWHTLPRNTPEDETPDDPRSCRSCCRARWRGLAHTPFDEFDESSSPLLGRWLERAAPSWPRGGAGGCGPATRRGHRAAADDRGVPSYGLGAAGAAATAPGAAAARR